MGGLKLREGRPHWEWAAETGFEPMLVRFKSQPFTTMLPSISPSVAILSVLSMTRLLLWSINLKLCGVSDIRKTIPKDGNNRITHGEDLWTQHPVILWSPSAGSSYVQEETRPSPALRSPLPSNERCKLFNNCRVIKARGKCRKPHWVLLPIAPSLCVLLLNSWDFWAPPRECQWPSHSLLHP